MCGVLYCGQRQCYDKTRDLALAAAEEAILLHHIERASVQLAFVVTLALVTGLASVVVAASDQVPALVCTFQQGAAWSYDAGTYKSAAPAPLTFGIEAVDLEGLSATLVIGGKPAGHPLRVVRALNANHFLEVAQEGFLNVTTVYDVDAATGTRPAIHSRHLGLLGQPIFAQYAGFCTAR